ncbi:hypothetical protein [Arthrobacter sp. UYEF21]|uniref:hypothetical protein n=1 Tax=Arthrobacter sp. UYEF21 TaxID=1756364 RepID=UPI00339968F7
MTKAKADGADTHRGDLAKALSGVAESLSGSPRLAGGQIVVRQTGENPATFVISESDGTLSVADTQGVVNDADTRVEILGDGKVLAAILRGDQDARESFLAGGIRVRGDLRYFSDLAVAARILPTPL